MRVAERALAGCVLDRQVTGLLTDASLCHGWAGVVQALWRAASDALDPGRSRPRCARHDGAWKTTSPAQARRPPAGSWKEHPASMLAQNDLPRAGGEPPAWDACLLLTL